MSNLRVIAGNAKKTKLKINERYTKPLSSRAKSALFSIISPIIPNARVLDLYAGSGALGIEALSRGASFVDFVDIEKKVTDIIEENLAKTNFIDSSEVYRMPSEIYVRDFKHEKSFDIIFIFQPYTITNKDMVKASMQLLNNKGVIVFEHEKRTKPGNVHGLELIDSRQYGRVGMTFYMKDTQI
jgi:16S rRNA (guanine(966)-N(2))-methyltransferase RsmD